MKYYQFVIYNNEYYDEDMDQGAVEHISDLYTKKADCKKDAKKYVRERCEECDLDDEEIAEELRNGETWEIKINEVSVVK